MRYGLARSLVDHVPTNGCNIDIYSIKGVTSFCIDTSDKALSVEMPGFLLTMQTVSRTIAPFLRFLPLLRQPLHFLGSILLPLRLPELHVRPCHGN